jgi:hypothetical protein
MAAKNEWMGLHYKYVGVHLGRFMFGFEALRSLSELLPSEASGLLHGVPAAAQPGGSLYFQ